MGLQHRDQGRRRHGLVEARRGVDVEGRGGVAAEGVDRGAHPAYQPLDLGAGDGRLRPGDAIAGERHGKGPVVQSDGRQQHLSGLQPGLQRSDRLRRGAAQPLIIREDAIQLGAQPRHLLVGCLDGDLRDAGLGLVAGGEEEAPLAIQPLALADLVLQRLDQRPGRGVGRRGPGGGLASGDHDVRQVGHLQRPDGLVVAAELTGVVCDGPKAAGGERAVADQVGLRSRRVEQLGFQGPGDRLGLGETGGGAFGEADHLGVGHLGAHPPHAAGVQLGADDRDRGPGHGQGFGGAAAPGQGIGQGDPGAGQFRVVVGQPGLDHDVDRALAAGEGRGVVASPFGCIGAEAQGQGGADRIGGAGRLGPPLEGLQPQLFGLGVPPLLFDQGGEAGEGGGAAAPQVLLVPGLAVQHLAQHRLRFGQPVHVAQRDAEVVERQVGRGAVRRRVGHGPGRGPLVLRQRLLLQTDRVHQRGVRRHVGDHARVVGRQTALFEPDHLGVFAFGLLEVAAGIVEERLGEAALRVLGADLPELLFCKRLRLSRVRLGRLEVADAGLVDGKGGQRRYGVSTVLQSRFV